MPPPPPSPGMPAHPLALPPWDALHGPLSPCHPSPWGEDRLAPLRALSAPLGALTRPRPALPPRALGCAPGLAPIHPLPLAPGAGVYLPGLPERPPGPLAHPCTVLDRAHHPGAGRAPFWCGGLVGPHFAFGHGSFGGAVFWSRGNIHG